MLKRWAEIRLAGSSPVAFAMAYDFECYRGTSCNGNGCDKCKDRTDINYVLENLPEDFEVAQ